MGKIMHGDIVYGGGGGASSVSDLTDVELTDLADGEILKYDATEEKWVNAEDGGSGGGSVVALPSLYSTKEKMVGLWTDNKPLYQKTATIANVNIAYSSGGGYAGLVPISSVASNVDYIWGDADMSKIYVPSAGVYRGVTSITIEGTNLNIWSPAKREGVTLTICAYYTKTTDTPVEDFNLQDFGIFAPVIYSLEEREIGVWTDGKPLYAKTFNIVPTSTSGVVDLSTLHIEKIISRVGGITRNASGTIQQKAFEYRSEAPTSNNYGFQCELRGTNLQWGIWGYEYTEVQEIRVTLQYTKTTDTAGSGKYTTLGTPTVHYSTDEQVIGTWIDGKTLYEITKVFPYDSSWLGKRNSVDHNISNIDFPVDCNIRFFVPSSNTLLSEAVIRNDGDSYTSNSSNFASSLAIEKQFFNRTQFGFIMGNMYSSVNINLIVTFQYTKTT